MTDNQYTYVQKSLGQKLGQNFNPAGIALFARLLWGNQHLTIPHLDVKDIREVNWHGLKAAGFKGCVFDKDNTLTEPYVAGVSPLLQASLEECKAVFENHLVVYSNSAGLFQFDPEGKEAGAVEEQLGIPVLRHADKKPAGGVAELEQLFSCQAHELVMVGDRYFTDVVYGNRNGLFTIRPAPLTLQGEPATVRTVRALEGWLIGQWRRRGVQAPEHPLVKNDAQLQTFLRQAAQVAA